MLTCGWRSTMPRSPIYNVILAELSPAGIMATPRPLRGPWFFLGVEHE
jgi:hypothetical protein